MSLLDLEKKLQSISVESQSANSSLFSEVKASLNTSVETDSSFSLDLELCGGSRPRISVS